MESRGSARRRSDKERCRWVKKDGTGDGTSWVERVRPIQAAREISGRGAGNEVAVGVMAVRQLGDVYLQASAFQSLRQRGRRLLASMVGIAIEDNVELSAAAVAELGKLGRCQVGPESAGGVAELCLPECGEIKESFDENDGRKLVHRLPCEQASLGARQNASRPWSLINPACNSKSKE